MSTQVIHNLHLAREYPSYSVSKCAGKMLQQNVALNANAAEMQVVNFHPGVVFTEAAEHAGIKEDDLQWDDSEFPLLY